MANRYCKNFLTKTCKAKSNPQDMFDFVVFKDCDAGMIESEVCLACDRHAFNEAKNKKTSFDEDSVPCGLCLLNIMNQLTESVDASFSATDGQMAFGLKVFKRLRDQEWGGLLDDPDMSKFRSRAKKE